MYLKFVHLVTYHFINFSLNNQNCHHEAHTTYAEATSLPIYIWGSDKGLPSQISFRQLVGCQVRSLYSYNFNLEQALNYTKLLSNINLTWYSDSLEHGLLAWYWQHQFSLRFSWQLDTVTLEKAKQIKKRRRDKEKPFTDINSDNYIKIMLTIVVRQFWINIFLVIECLKFGVCVFLSFYIETDWKKNAFDFQWPHLFIF